ncbi:MAG: pyridoxine 5'-phosphate synthase [Desulfobacterales bacterium]
MAKLLVQLDPVAALREAGRSTVPDPAAAAVVAELGGADGIVVHLREDRRSINDRDVRILRKVVHSRFDLKMAPTSEMLGLALDIKPEVVVLVPEMREESAPAGGLDLMVHGAVASETIANLAGSGIAVGTFIEPDPDQLKLAHQCGAGFVEIRAGAFCAAASRAKRQHLLSRIVDTVKLAYRLKIGVQVGGGIDFTTIGSFKGLAEINAFTIGHGIVSRAVLIGMQATVREMKRLIEKL